MSVTVAHIITKLELGGAQRNTLFTVSHLDSRKFRPILISGEQGILDAEARTLAGVEFIQVPTLVRRIRPFSDVRALINLVSLFSKIQPMIVHTHSSKAGILGRVAAKLAGVPVVVHSIHGYGFTAYQPFLLRYALIILERIASTCTNRFFAVSESNRRVGIELGLFAPEQSTVIRSGIDLDAFRNTTVDVIEKRNELGIDTCYPLVGMIGALKPQKAPLDFVRVAALVYQANPDVRFLLVGEGELQDAVEREVSRLGLRQVFRLVGWRHDIAEIMKSLDIFVLTSLWEGLPRVYLEALSSGLPVVGTRVDGAAEVIHHGVNGFLTEPGDIHALAEGVLTLLTHPEQRHQMGKSGQPLPSCFDIREMVRQQEEEYQQLIKEYTKGKEGKVVEPLSHV